MQQIAWNERPDKAADAIRPVAIYAYVDRVRAEQRLPALGSADNGEVHL